LVVSFVTETGKRVRCFYFFNERTGTGTGKGVKNP